MKIVKNDRGYRTSGRGLNKSVCRWGGNRVQKVTLENRGSRTLGRGYRIEGDGGSNESGRTGWGVGGG